MPLEEDGDESPGGRRMQGHLRPCPAVTAQPAAWIWGRDAWPRSPVHLLQPERTRGTPGGGGWR